MGDTSASHLFPYPRTFEICDAHACPSPTLNITCYFFSCFNTHFVLLGAFSKLEKVAISFAISACLPVRPHGTTRLPLDGFSWNLVFMLCYVINVTHTLAVCNTYCFATVTMVARRGLSFTLQAHRLSFFPPSNFITEFSVYILFLSRVIWIMAQVFCAHKWSF